MLVLQLSSLGALDRRLVSLTVFSLNSLSSTYTLINHILTIRIGICHNVISMLSHERSDTKTIYELVIVARKFFSIYTPNINLKNKFDTASDVLQNRFYLSSSFFSIRNRIYLFKNNNTEREFNPYKNTISFFVTKNMTRIVVVRSTVQ